MKHYKVEKVSLTTITTAFPHPPQGNDEDSISVADWLDGRLAEGWKTVSLEYDSGVFWITYITKADA